MAFTPATNKQPPGEAILNYFGQQAYLGNQKIVTLTSSLTTTETNLILLTCPGVSTGLAVSLFVDLLKLSAVTAASSGVLKAYLNPTVSVAGTAATVQNSRPAIVRTVVGVATLAPTTTANGSLYDVGVGGPYTSEITSFSQIPLILDPGQSLLITGTGSAAATGYLSLGWYEL